MTALTAERNTERRTGDILSLPAAAASVFFAGAIVARDANGRATPGATATTLRGVGRALSTVDNSSGPDDAENVAIEKGVFHFANDTVDPVSRADVGNDCYMVDDQTVAKTDGAASRSVAGKVFDVDDQGVWVDFR